jgi:hypothetical protein
MPNRLIAKLRLDPTALAILLASAAVVRVVMGYRSFPSVDDFTYIPLAWAQLDPELFPRDEILRGYVNHVPLWPGIIWVLERTVGLAEGLFVLTLFLTFLTVYFLRQLVRSLGGSDYSLPLVLALAVTVSIRGIGRGAYDGLLGDAFHMQWLAIALVLGAYHAFVSKRPIRAGMYLGGAAWVHPLVAFHGAVCVAIGGLATGKRGIPRTIRTGLTAIVASLPVSLSLVREAAQRKTAAPVSETVLLSDATLLRLPHHYELELIPFLLAGLVGLLALAAMMRIAGRENAASTTFAGLLAGNGILLFATFIFHGPLFFQDQPANSFWIYALDLSRTTPLFLGLCGIAVAAALPGPEEPLHTAGKRTGAERFLTFSVLFSVIFYLLINLVTVERIWWIYVLGLFSTLAYLGRRGVIHARGLTAALLVLAMIAGATFLRHAEIQDLPSSAEANLHSWVRTETPRNALFIIPPGLETFRINSMRSVYVDFKSYPPSQPALAWEWRQRLVEIVDSDATAMSLGRGWPGVFWWDRAFAKRNPPERIAELLLETGADFFVMDRLYEQLPPHLPIGMEQSEGTGLDLAFENARYRVFRLAASP